MVKKILVLLLFLPVLHFTLWLSLATDIEILDVKNNTLSLVNPVNAVLLLLSVVFIFAILIIALFSRKAYLRISAFILYILIMIYTGWLNLIAILLSKAGGLDSKQDFRGQIYYILIAGILLTFTGFISALAALITGRKDPKSSVNSP